MKLPTIPPLIPDGRGYGRQQRERSRDRDRLAEQPWRAWYHLPIWDHPVTGLRAIQLARRPICEKCKRARATVAHHKRPHGGVWELFIDPNNLESVCKRCHDGEVQRGERAGNYAARIELVAGVAIPTNVLHPQLARSAVPLTIVCGAPAAGKTEYVRQKAQRGDKVIDLDDIIADLAGSATRTAEAKRRHLCQALIERNRRLALLTSGAPAWFVVGAAAGWERRRWADGLGAQSVVLIDTPLRTCIARIRRDPLRAPIADELEEAAHGWFARYSASNIAREIRVDGIGGFV